MCAHGWRSSFEHLRKSTEKRHHVPGRAVCPMQPMRQILPARCARSATDLDVVAIEQSSATACLVDAGRQIVGALTVVSCGSRWSSVAKRARPRSSKPCRSNHPHSS